MPDLLLELFSEEIPARMQARAAEDLRKLVTDRLVARRPRLRGRQGLRHAAPAGARGAGRAGAAARRQGGEEGPARRRARGRDPGLPQGAGPQVDRRGQGAARQEGRLLRRGDREAGPAGDRGDRRDRARGGEELSRGRSRCAGASNPPSPARSAGCGRCIRSSPPSGRRPRSPTSCAFAVDGIAAGDETRGHRFMAPEPFKVRRLDDYVAKLEKAKVVLDPQRRAGDHPRRRQEPRLRAGLRAGRGRRAAGRGRRPGRMAGGADGRRSTRRSSRSRPR